MSSTYRHIALPPNGFAPGVVHWDSKGRVRIPSSAKRQFACLMGDRINYREIEEIQAATPVLYELKPLSDGTHQLVRVHRICIAGDQHFVLQEIMPGHLQAYAMLTDGYAVAYEEVSFDDAPHLTEKHRERLIAENAALCRHPGTLLWALEIYMVWFL